MGIYTHSCDKTLSPFIKPGVRSLLQILSNVNPDNPFIDSIIELMPEEIASRASRAIEERKQTQAALQQMQEQIQQMAAQNQEMGKELEGLRAEDAGARGKTELQQIKSQTELQRTAMENETSKTRVAMVGKTNMMKLALQHAFKLRETAAAERRPTT